MNYRQAITFIAVSLLVSGCAAKNHEFVFKTTKVPVNVELNSCSLIQSIDGVEITQSMIQDNKIVIGDKAIKCSDVKTNQIGQIEVTYDYDKQLYKQLIDVVDEEAPVINVEDEYEVEAGNEWFDLTNRVVFSDNYDKDYFKEITGDFDINTPGEYKLVAVAEDNSGNRTEKEFVVNVLDKETPTPEVIEKPVYVPSGPSNNGSSTIDDDGKVNNSGGYDPSGSTQNGSGGTNYDDPDIDDIGQSGIGNGSNSGPFISGTRDISVSVGTSLNDLIYQLGQGISSSSSITIDYSNVNLSVPGSYTVWYYSSDGVTKSVVVTVN